MGIGFLLGVGIKRPRSVGELLRVNSTGTILSGLNLSGPNLTGSNLSGINLSGANLSGTKLPSGD